jgi:hypothetical protein
VIADDVVGEIARLKPAPGEDIVQYGFGAVSRLLLDELRLWVYPQIVGERDLPFGHGPAARCELTDVMTLSNGIVILSYLGAC